MSQDVHLFLATSDVVDSYIPDRQTQATDIRKQLLTACTIVPEVVNVNTRSNGDGQVLTPAATKPPNGFWR